MLSELLEPFRQAEGDPNDEKAPRLAHTAVQLIGDPRAQKVLATWCTIPIGWKKPRRRIPEDFRERWDWLWLGVRFDPGHLSLRAGVSLIVLEGVLERLKGGRLVYPDGSISAWAQGVLDGAISEAAGR